MPCNREVSLFLEVLPILTPSSSSSHNNSRNSSQDHRDSNYPDNPDRLDRPMVSQDKFNSNARCKPNTLNRCVNRQPTNSLRSRRKAMANTLNSMLTTLKRTVQMRPRSMSGTDT